MKFCSQVSLLNFRVAVCPHRMFAFYTLPASLQSHKRPQYAQQSHTLCVAVYIPIMPHLTFTLFEIAFSAYVSDVALGPVIIVRL